MRFPEIRDRIEQITQYSLRAHAEKQTWPGYYNRRKEEFLTFLDYLPNTQFDRILEIGCGMGFYSAFLSNIGEEVISTDLEQQSIDTHTPGLSLTKAYLNELNIDNVKVMPASADDLPYADNTFDMVFSSHVLEHVPNSDKAISEINRVLKPGGYNFCVVPTTMDRLYNLPLYHLYLVRRSATIFKGRLYRQKNQSGLSTKTAGTGADRNSAWQHFPFPPPHGVLPHFFREVQKWTPSGWKSLITKRGTIPLIRYVGVQLNPLLPLVSPFSSNLAIRLHSQTRDIENRLGRLPLFRSLGISLIVVTQKL